MSEVPVIPARYRSSRDRIAHALRERANQGIPPAHQRQAYCRQGLPPRWLFRIRDRIDPAAFKTSASLGSLLLNRIRYEILTWCSYHPHPEFIFSTQKLNRQRVPRVHSNLFLNPPTRVTCSTLRTIGPR